jgi:hypothetical protein
MLLNRTEHTFLLAAYLLTRGDCTVQFTRKQLMTFSGLYGWDSHYHKRLNHLVSSNFLMCYQKPPSNSLYYSLTPISLNYLTSLGHLL